jgi:hypothetical protein
MTEKIRGISFYKELMGRIRGAWLKYSGLQMLSRLPFVALLLLLGVNVCLAADSDCLQPQGQVSRAMFTTKIEDREPVDQVLILENKYKQVYFFTDLRHFEGQDVTHLWEYNGHVVSKKVFSVRGPRWRVYSTVKLGADMLGRWTVVVTDNDGCPIKAAVFQYVASNPNGRGSAIIKLK